MMYQLCGKIEGRPRDEVVAEFAVAADRIEQHSGGYASVYNPVTSNRLSDPQERRNRQDITYLLKNTQALIVLPDWEDDVNSCLLVAVAKSTACPIMTLDELINRKEQ